MAYFKGKNYVIRSSLESIIVIHKVDLKYLQSGILQTLLIIQYSFRSITNCKLDKYNFSRTTFRLISHISN